MPSWELPKYIETKLPTTFAESFVEKQKKDWN